MLTQACKFLHLVRGKHPAGFRKSLKKLLSLLSFFKRHVSLFACDVRKTGYHLEGVRILNMCRDIPPFYARGT